MIQSSIRPLHSEGTVLTKQPIHVQSSYPDRPPLPVTRSTHWHTYIAHVEDPFDLIGSQRGVEDSDLAIHPRGHEHTVALQGHRACATQGEGQQY